MTAARASAALAETGEAASEKASPAAASLTRSTALNRLAGALPFQHATAEMRLDVRPPA
jgi:hypothetical protein